MRAVRSIKENARQARATQRRLRSTTATTTDEVSKNTNENSESFRERSLCAFSRNSEAIGGVRDASRIVATTVSDDASDTRVRRAPAYSVLSLSSCVTPLRNDWANLNLSVTLYSRLSCVVLYFACIRVRARFFATAFHPFSIMLVFVNVSAQRRDVDDASCYVARANEGMEGSRPSASSPRIAHDALVFARARALSTCLKRRRDRSRAARDRATTIATNVQ